jgi:hypothetical protein
MCFTACVLQVFHILHGHNLEGAEELAPGVYVGGEAAAVKAVGDAYTSLLAALRLRI